MPTDHPKQVKRSSFQIRLRLGGILGQALQYHWCTNVYAGTTIGLSRYFSTSTAKSLNKVNLFEK